MRKSKIKWTDEIDAYIKERINKTTSRGLSEEIKQNFGLSVDSSGVLFRARNILGCIMNGTGKSTRKIASYKTTLLHDDTTPINSGITLFSATKNHCLYMTSPNEGSHVCGELRASGSSFCKRHHEICYMGTK